MTRLRHSITFFVFSLFYCKYICDIYLSMLAFNGLGMQVQQHIYSQEYKRHSVVVSLMRNDHMQVYTIIMEGK